MVTALIVIAVFGGLIFVHELGHFLVAKWSGVRVDEFSLGFGPRIAGFRRGETEYGIRVLPLGGFVRMAGMNPQFQEETPPPGRGFSDRSVGQRMAIVGAGPVMNFLLAVALLIYVFAAIGYPRPTLEIGKVQSGFPAAAAGLQPGDVLVSIDGRPLRDWRDLQGIVQASPDRALEFEVRRDGRELRFLVAPAVSETGRGFVGIVPEMRVQRVALLQAVPEAVTMAARIVVMTLAGIVGALLGQGTSEILGPVGISQQIGEASRLGLDYLLVLAAILSANLGLLNLLPIPALDGSRLAFLLVEVVRGRPLDPDKEGWIHFVGFALIMLLLLAVTYRDVLRLTVG